MGFLPAGKYKSRFFASFQLAQNDSKAEKVNKV